MRRLLLIVYSVVLTFPIPAGAQAIRGRLVDAANQAPILGGRLELLDLSGHVVASGESSGSGAFALMAPTSGRYRFRAVAIGFEPRPVVDITVGRADTILGDVPMRRATFRLPDLLATVRRVLTWTSHFYRLWDQVTGACVAVVPYSLHYRNLLASGTGANRTAEVILALHQGNARGSRSSDTTVMLTLNVPDDSTNTSTYSGLVVVPSAIDVTDWTLIVTQPEQPAGGDWEYARLPLVAGPLAVSDLVLGSAGHHVAWDNHGDRVVLASREPIDVDDALDLYYQVKSAVNRPAVHSEIAVYRTDRGVKAATPVLHFAVDRAMSAGLNPAHQPLDLSHLEQGRYRIEVEVADRATGVTVKQAVTVYLQ